MNLHKEPQAAGRGREEEEGGEEEEEQEAAGQAAADVTPAGKEMPVASRSRGAWAGRLGSAARGGGEDRSRQDPAWFFKFYFYFLKGDASLLPPCKMCDSPNFPGLSPGAAAPRPLAPGRFRGAGLSPFPGASPAGQGDSQLGPAGLCWALHAAAGAVPSPCRARR